MCKSKLCLAIFIFCFINSSSAVADELNQSKTSVLIEVDQALGELGDSIVKLADGVKHLADGENNTLDYLFAKKTKNTLRDLSIRSTQLRNQNTMAVGIRNEYLLDPRPQVWYESKMKLGIIIKSGSQLLQEWEAERSNIAHEESIKQHLSTLNKRMNILKKLEQMEPPVTDEELAALNQVNQTYSKLINQFDAAILELDTYIRECKQDCTTTF